MVSLEMNFYDSGTLAVFSMQTKRYAKRFSACCHLAQACHRDSGEDTVAKD